MRYAKRAKQIVNVFSHFDCPHSAKYSCKFNSTFRYPKSFEFETLVKEYHLVCERYFGRIYFIIAILLDHLWAAL